MPQSGKNNPAYRHGHTNGGKFSPTYHSWVAMMCRCYNPNMSHYHVYGGRGIRVCRKWHKFEGFLADMGTRPKGTSLDRRDGDKGYNKSNCRWATSQMQHRNRRTPTTDAYKRRILQLCRKPKRLVDLIPLMGIHFEVTRQQVRLLVRSKQLTSKRVVGDHPQGKTLLLQTL